MAETVVIAARINAAARGGEILASDLVYVLLRGLDTFNFAPYKTATLKGLDGGVELHRFADDIAGREQPFGNSGRPHAKRMHPPYTPCKIEIAGIRVFSCSGHKL